MSTDSPRGGQPTYRCAPWLATTDRVTQLRADGARCCHVGTSGVSFAAVAEVQVRQSLQLLVGRLLDGDQVLVSTSRGADELVELALQRGDLACLGVLDDEDHHEGDRRRHRVERCRPPVGKACDGTDHAPDHDQHGSDNSGRGVGDDLTDTMQRPARPVSLTANRRGGGSRPANRRVSIVGSRPRRPARHGGSRRTLVVDRWWVRRCSWFEGTVHDWYLYPPIRRNAPGSLRLAASLANERHDGAMTDVLVIADTHLGAGCAGRLMERLGSELRTVDLVLHVGDITDNSVLQALRTAVGESSVHAVLGNNDSGLCLVERLTIDVAGCEGRWSMTAAQRSVADDGCGAGSPTPTGGVRAFPPAVVRGRRPQR